ncbi:hypothetical protein [Bifidobacterium cuniculi]|uniref:Uncharacterized protein n=1 Tax=Bifidobacterium cuniculi TaxID=1688 RepID=A0A087AW32_9BIFI|nr:hypothetical protein [Bifidobacterium cuniculi]KFI62982.1 hypothetical protein BCUN_0815 [Bifidobacterium cuniculi]
MSDNTPSPYGTDPYGNPGQGQLPYGQTGEPQYPFGAAEDQPQQAQPAYGQQPRYGQYGQNPYTQPQYGQPGATGPQQPYQYQYQGTSGGQQYQPYPSQNDSGSFGWAVLGFLIPIVGLVLFLVWHTTKPKCAKMAGIGALVGFCLNLVFTVFAFGSGAFLL